MAGHAQEQDSLTGHGGIPAAAQMQGCSAEVELAKALWSNGTSAGTGASRY